MAKKQLLFFFFLIVFLTQHTSIAQQNTSTLFPVPAVIYEGDTIANITLPPVYCFADKVFKDYKQKMAWDRLKYNVKKVYPYAILAAAKLKEYDQLLAQIEDDKEKRHFTKMAEKQLKKQFGKELENLSINQGRILIKLIDRETGKTTYNIVKDMRGGFSAIIWQSVAIMFSSSLKAEYDADGNDKSIEDAIRLVENGMY